MMETGDPLAGTERNEVRAKNSGTLVVKQGKIALNCQQYLQTHHSITTLLHYSNGEAELIYSLGGHLWEKSEL